MKSDMIQKQHQRHYEVQQDYGLGITRVSGIEVKNDIEAKQTENYRQETIFPHSSNWVGYLRFCAFFDDFSNYLVFPFLIVDLDL